MFHIGMIFEGFLVHACIIFFGHSDVYSLVTATIKNHNWAKCVEFKVMCLSKIISC